MTTVKNIGQLRMQIQSQPAGNVHYTDPTPDHGGLGEYPTPVGLLAEALAACAMTVLSKAALKNGLNPEGYHAEVKEVEIDHEKNCVSRIALRLYLPGSVDEKLRPRLEAFAKNACTVGNTLTCEKQFEFVYE